ncbi:hypothetical protein [Flavobacterium agrisoli]|uniref:Uncharacterized protein n=1 Tax=Flavobacterium agrisoli TaxID=2793066 RepID=A0A934UJI8_9FLAO|nr:hypothetical protein [Flavobacterium agrisoli]MBK0370006.1 hypothetical protein [Flavobacterium agrisoli]
MKKTFIFCTVLGLQLLSCGHKPEKSTPEIPKDKEQKVGADLDKHDCKTSAGYTWSELEQKCIRLFEEAKPLQPFENSQSNTTLGYVLFKGNKAELFLESEPNSILLERKSEGQAWVNKEYELFTWKGYVLKKKGSIIYTAN